MNNHTQGYALALFTLGSEQQKLRLLKQETEVVISLFEAEPRYIKVLSSHDLPIDSRLKLVTKAFADVGLTMRNFLCILVKRSYISKVTTILRQTTVLINRELGINEGVVYSPVPLAPEQVSQLETIAARQLKISSLSLVNKLDRTLLTGFRIEVGDEVIEDSGLSRLKSMHELLLNGGKYGN